MRIAYLVSQYPAPSHTFVRRELEALRSYGVEVDTFSVRPPAESERASVDPAECERTFFLLEEKAAMVRAHARAIARRPRRYVRTLRDALAHRNPGARAALWSAFHFAEAISLADELERRGVVHLHNHFANSGATVGYLASRFLSLPWSLTLHGPSEFDHAAGPLLPAKVEHADFVVCASHYVRSQALRYVPPAEGDKMFLVRCGIELERCPERRPRPEGGPVRIVSVGRLAADKGQAGLLDAFRAVLDEGVDAELRIVGDGPLRASLEQRAEALELGSRCVFLGRLPEHEVLATVADADIFALPSFMEGLPVVLMEAMAIGVPVVSASVAGIPELVEPQETGLLFPCGDFDAMARSLLRLCRDPALRARLAEAGRARLVREFAMPEVVLPLLGELRARYGSPDERVQVASDAVAHGAPPSGNDGAAAYQGRPKNGAAVIEGTTLDAGPSPGSEPPAPDAS